MQPRRRTLRLLLIFPLSAIPGTGIAGDADDLDQINRLIEGGHFAPAIEKLEPLVRRGNAAALTRLGLLYYAGRGVPVDEARAYGLFEKAAAAEDRDAMFLIGRMNLLGHGPARSNPDADRDAARWFFESARRGHADAQYHLGLLFYAGTGVQKNPEEALKWIRRAAENGHAAARQFGTGTPPAPAGSR